VIQIDKGVLINESHTDTSKLSFDKLFAFETLDLVTKTFCLFIFMLHNIKYIMNRSQNGIYKNKKLA
tara:strand:+ start:79 stop:279 length:201 start_codon:yes stop_codon:yes gene_type:complete